MKTKIIFFLFVMVCFITKVMAQYPIPSYNISVAQPTYFEEQDNKALIPAITEGKRQVNIQTQCPTISSQLPCAEVWVFSLDRQDILGPYYMNNDDILQVGIDSRSWGVYIEVLYELDASVWIGDGSSSPLKKVTPKHAASY